MISKSIFASNTYTPRTSPIYERHEKPGRGFKNKSLYLAKQLGKELKSVRESMNMSLTDFTAEFKRLTKYKNSGAKNLANTKDVFDIEESGAELTYFALEKVAKALGCRVEIKFIPLPETKPYPKMDENL